MAKFRSQIVPVVLALMVACLSQVAIAQIPDDGKFRWKVSPPFLEIDAQRLPAAGEHPWIAVKDPSIVRYDGKWHLFCTLRRNKTGDGRIRIGYLSFADWSSAQQSQWQVLDLTPGYHGAPQIFWFAPHKKWYLIYQAEDQRRGLKYGPCFSTNGDLTKANQWTLPEPLYVVPDGVRAGLDFWVICDDAKAHLFFTTLNGRMWRAETALADFPNKQWSKPKVVIQADIFEASHTYALAGENRYFTIVEAIGNNRRYFKGYIAEDLEGPWKPVADSLEQPLVGPTNVVDQEHSWATSYSHGEFIRAGYNQKMLVNPKELRLLFQGVNDQQYRNRSYGQIPWRLGILTRAR